MKKLSDYVDKLGMVVTKEGDGGDSCAHGCAIFYGALVTKAKYDPLNFFSYIHLLESFLWGRFRRHPDGTKWYSNVDTLSRDQMTPLLILLGFVHSNGLLRALFFRHVFRGLLFAWNTRMNGAVPGTPQYTWKIPDLTGPEIWACWIRAFKFWPFYPLLLLFDLQTLGSSIQRRYFNTDNIQMNQVLVTDFSTRVMPTPISLLAHWIYGKKIAKAALKAMWGDQEYQPPVDQYLIPLVESWKIRE